jgi:hypothetical protein
MLAAHRPPYDRVVVNVAGRAPDDDTPGEDPDGDRAPRRRWALTGKGYRITDPEPPPDAEDGPAENP